MFVGLFLFSLGKSQSRLVINNDAYLVIDNNAFFVIDNEDGNALTTAGTGGKIISEGEDDVIKWNVGTATGVHLIPWSTSVATGSVKIPLSINITTAGVGGGGHILLSTYETSDVADMNNPMPASVTNMCEGFTNTDGSLKVVDRFWQINASNYTTKPAVNMAIAYNSAANEIGGFNTLVESNLEAQRFNPNIVTSGTCYAGTGSWESLLFGTNTSALDKITNIIVSPGDFYKDWILTDKLNPLPVELNSFNAQCEGGEVVINWATQTEINNNYFVVEKSNDGTVFSEIAIIQGAGNSNVILSYSIIDSDPSVGISYYRLKQVDFDGATIYHQIINSDCSVNEFEVTQLLLNNNDLNFNITSSQNENIIIYFYDYRGRVIRKKSIFLNEGLNFIELNNFNISTGIYMLSITGELNNYSTKLFKK